MTRRRRRDAVAGAWLCLAGLTGSAAVARLAPQARPIYDGTCFSPPYVYLHPPAGLVGGQTAQGVTKQVAITTPGASPAVVVVTGESPAQAQLLVPDRALSIPAGTSQVTISITPVEPPATGPRDGRVAGNVYRFAVTAASGAPVTVASGQEVSIVLRGPGANANSRIEQFVSGAWTPLKSTPVGCGNDTLTANSGSFGDFAVVSPSGGAAGGPPSGGSGGGSSPDRTLIGLAVGIAVVILAVAAALVRLGRRSR